MSNENRASSVREQLGVKPRSVKAFSVESSRTRAGGSQRKKKEGHDELIYRLAQRGFDVRLTLMGGGSVLGPLQESDRFTITILDSFGQKVLYYKHAIISMQFSAPVVDQE